MGCSSRLASIDDSVSSSYSEVSNNLANPGSPINYLSTVNRCTSYFYCSFRYSLNSSGSLLISNAILVSM